MTQNEPPAELVEVAADLLCDWMRIADERKDAATAVLAAVTPQIEARVVGEIVADLRAKAPIMDYGPSWFGLELLKLADRIERGDYKESQP